MEIVKTFEVLPSALRNASGTVDFDMPAGAAGVQLFINITANAGTGPTLTPKISHVSPQDSTRIIDVVTGVALNTNAASRLAVLPGVIAVANAIANEPCSPKMRLTYTLGGTGGPSFTFSVVAVAYK